MWKVISFGIATASLGISFALGGGGVPRMATPGNATLSSGRLAATRHEQVGSAIQTALPIAPKRKAPSERELYSMLFNYVVHVETIADAGEAKGLDRSDFRYHIMKAAGLTNREYAYVLDSSYRFAMSENILRVYLKEHRHTPIDKKNLRLPGDQAMTARMRLRPYLKARNSSLDSELLSLHMELGQERSLQLLTYLQQDYIKRVVGNSEKLLTSRSSMLQPGGSGYRSAMSVSKPALAPPAQAQVAQTNNVRIDSDYTCDSYDYACADAQVGYLGPNGQVDVYANVDFGDAAVEDDNDGYIELEDIYSEGDLSSNNGVPNQYCSAEGSCSGTATFSSNTDYAWDSTATVEYYADCNDGSGNYCLYDDEYTAEVGVYIDAPDISQISPDSVSPSTSGILTISGDGFFSPFGNQPTVAVTNQSTAFTSFTAQSYNVNNGEITVSYGVTSGPPTGLQSVTVNNGFGSDSASLTINSPPPTISSASVSGGAIQAGQTQTVTLTGMNFGNTTPTVVILSGAPTGLSIVSGTLAYTQQGSGTNVLSFQTAAVASTAAGSVTFQIQVQQNNQTALANAPAISVVPESFAPEIFMVNTTQDLSNCTNGSPTASGSNETTIFAGQLILLCVVAPPSGFSIASQSWQFQNIQDITGGFTNSAGTGQPTYTTGGDEASDPTLNNSYLQFYFVVPNVGETVTYTWTLNNGSTGQSSADFNVQGPTGNTLPVAQMQTDGSGVAVQLRGGNPVLTTANAPGFSTVGIVFSTTASAPSGANQKFMWVQLINGLSQPVLSGAGSGNSAANPTVGLDGTYPYASASSSSTNDTPNIQLPNIYGEVQEGFDATMYLLWDPALPSGCTPAQTDATNHYAQSQSNCTSIPIPLGSVRWKWSGCAINTQLNQSNNTTWIRQCGIQELDQAQPSGYPEWGQTVNPGGPS